LLAVLVVEFWSWLRMNWSSAPPESVTKDISLLSVKVMFAGWPFAPAAQGVELDKTGGDPEPIWPTVPLRFCSPVSVTFDDPSNTMYPTYTSGCPGVLGLGVTSDIVSAALNAHVKLVGQLVVMVVACADAIADHPSANKPAIAETNLFIDNFIGPWIRPCTACDVKSIVEIVRLFVRDVI
jgi:hypothetical protein